MLTYMLYMSTWMGIFTNIFYTPATVLNSKSLLIMLIFNKMWFHDVHGPGSSDMVWVLEINTCLAGQRL